MDALNAINAEMTRSCPTIITAADLDALWDRLSAAEKADVDGGSDADEAEAMKREVYGNRDRLARSL